MAKNIVASSVRVHQEQIIGKRFGDLVVAGLSFGRSKKTVAVCDCGEVVVSSLFDMRSGKTKSCGCRRVSNKAAVTHGMTKTPEYTSWRAMCERCLNKKSKCYDDYGGRGILVFPEWVGSGGFDKWLSHIGTKPFYGMTQERIDNKGNYEPGNVRWATMLEQARNRRANKTMRSADYRGEVKSLFEWASLIGISKHAFNERLRRGLTMQEIMTHPNNPIASGYRGEWDE